MSDSTTAAALFKHKPSKLETKADATTTAARAIIRAEVNEREAKTEKLRAARLAVEEAERLAEAKSVKPAKGRVRKKKTAG